MTFAERIWKSRPDCIGIAKGYGFSYEEAEDIFQKTAMDCIKHEKTFDPNRSSLDFWVKLRFRSNINNLLRRKKRFNEIIDDQELYNHNERNSDFVQSPIFRGKKLKLALNGLKIIDNEKNIIYVTTIEKNKVNLGDSVFITGLNDDKLSEITKKRLRNKNSDDIQVNEVIDTNTFSIRVNFHHEIANVGVGGEKGIVQFVRKSSYLRSENPRFILTGDNEENEKLTDIQKEKCLEKLNPRERVILQYNLFPEHNNEIMFLGFKDPKSPEPKFRNDGSPLQHGDKYYIQDENNGNLKDENWRVFLNRSWVIAESAEIKIKPMTTERIAEKLQMAAGTVGELLSRAKTQFALCMQEAGYA